MEGNRLVLKSADPSVDHKAGLVFIEVNIKHKVCDDCSVPTSGTKKRDGKLEITTGQSGADAVVSIVPTNMLP